MAGDRERLIRERAYEIWEREGRPEGRDAEHWRQAAAELAAGEALAAAPPSEAPAPKAPPQRRSRAVPRRDGGNGAASARRKPEAP